MREALCNPQAARGWHGLTAAVAAFALVLQLVLIFNGDAVLVEASAAPALPVRVWRFFTYFTVQSNFLVLFTAATLALDPARDGRLWRIARLDALVGITMTGVVHLLFLRPLLHLEDWSYVADKLLHVAVPLLAFLGWVLFGPRGRVTRAVLLPALMWPLVYIVFTGVHGAIADWYPYPFTDVTAHGYPRVIVNGIAVAVLFFLGELLAKAADERSPLGRFDSSARTTS